jgi:hypothetical protein
VRELYEQVVADIQPDKDFAFADECVVWPSKTGLCYPVFEVGTLQASDGEARGITRRPGRSRSVPHDQVEGKLVFNEGDRESLLEMRAKLSMELVWLKQAIASRRKVRH